MSKGMFHADPLSFTESPSAVKRFAVVGTGNMARIRTEAFLASGSACLCGVASGQLKNAQAFAQKFGCSTYTDDYHDLARSGLDMLLVEVPHEVQDEVVLWSLGSGFHTLVGGCLATRAKTAERITHLSADKSLVVEAGYEARYKRVWELTKQTVAEGLIGDTVAVRSLALYPAPPDSWYYSEQKSGGMVLTHMSYAFLNPLRWIFGDPQTVSAFANQKQQRGADKVKHELCSANLMFANDVICTVTSGFVKPKSLDAWHVSFIGTRGSLKLCPGDMDAGSLTVYPDDQPPLTYTFDVNDAFIKQAQSFTASVNGPQSNLNPAHDAAVDVQLAELIVNSIEEKATLDYRPKLTSN